MRKPKPHGGARAESPAEGGPGQQPASPARQVKRRPSEDSRVWQPNCRSRDPRPQGAETPGLPAEPPVLREQRPAVPHPSHVLTHRICERDTLFYNHARAYEVPLHPRESPAGPPTSPPTVEKTRPALGQHPVFRAEVEMG